jgi:hypothetical protein
MIIELHSHTHYSRGKKVLYDGLDPPDAMVMAARGKGIGMLAITDHNHVKGLKEAREAGRKAGVEIIPGEEVSTLSGHVLALGISEAIPPDLSAEETIGIIKSQGGVSIAPHPFDVKMDGIRGKAMLCDAVETFNPFNFDRISNFRARRFVSKHGLTATAGSDAHSKEMVGLGTIRADAQTADEALKAIKKGSFVPISHYPPLSCIKDFAIRKLQKSYAHTQYYIDSHYGFPKSLMAAGMLRLVRLAPGHIDRAFDVLAYTSFGVVVGYSILLALLDI